MTASPFTYRRCYPLRHGYTVTLSLDGARLEAEWSPNLPIGRRARKLLPAYRKARNDFLATLGLPVTVIEL